MTIRSKNIRRKPAAIASQYVADLEDEISRLREQFTGVHMVALGALQIHDDGRAERLEQALRHIMRVTVAIIANEVNKQ